MLIEGLHSTAVWVLDNNTDALALRELEIVRFGGRGVCTAARSMRMADRRSSHRRLWLPHT